MDEDDIRIRNALRRAVAAEVSFRNDLAHADWEVGWVTAETNEPVPAAAHKIKSQDGVPLLSNLGIGTNDIISHINELQRIKQMTRAFGGICRKMQRKVPVKVAYMLEVLPAGPAGGTIVRFAPEWEALARAKDAESLRRLKDPTREQEEASQAESGK
ncbi:hypothetical protein GFY24_40015 [Nocardia sp. SYP-A9097]|nr:hypothetical protein [Nocardia sp. SYP-A9097]